MGSPGLPDVSLFTWLWTIKTLSVVHFPPETPTWQIHDEPISRPLPVFLRKISFLSSASRSLIDHLCRGCDIVYCQIYYRVQGLSVQGRAVSAGQPICAIHRVLDLSDCVILSHTLVVDAYLQGRGKIFSWCHKSHDRTQAVCHFLSSLSNCHIDLWK